MFYLYLVFHLSRIFSEFQNAFYLPLPFYHILLTFKLVPIIINKALFYLAILRNIQNNFSSTTKTSYIQSQNMLRPGQNQVIFLKRLKEYHIYLF